MRCRTALKRLYIYLDLSKAIFFRNICSKSYSFRSSYRRAKSQKQPDCLVSSNATDSLMISKLQWSVAPRYFRNPRKTLDASNIFLYFKLIDCCGLNEQHDALSYSVFPCVCLSFLFQLSNIPSYVSMKKYYLLYAAGQLRLSNRQSVVGTADYIGIW